MNTLSKNVVWFIAAVVIVGGAFLFSQRDNTMSDRTSDPNNNLYPEQTISHGHGLAVDIKDSNKLYIATHYGLLVLVNEKDLYRVGKSRDDYMGFSPHPTESNIFFTSGHPSYGGNLGFQRSDDGGVTWKKISDGVGGPVDFHAMTVSPVNPNLIYGWYRGDLQRSGDQGKNWEIVNRNILPVYLAADSQNENTLYAATSRGQGVLVSHDKGVNWVSLSPQLEDGAVSTVAVHPREARILLVFSEKLGGLGKSIDQGKTWGKVTQNFGGETILHIAFDRNNPNIVYALTHENKLYKSADAGDTWNNIR